MEQIQTAELVTRRPDGIPVTSSLLIAEEFGKKHQHVLEAIKNIECSDDFRASNFRLSSYISVQGKELPMYEITKDGFSWVVLGYKGKKAAEFKEKFINTFNRLLEQKQIAKPLTRQEQIMQAMCFLQEDVNALKQQNEIQQERILLQAHEAAIAAPKVEYYDEVLRSDKAITATVIAKELGMSAVTLNQVLHGLGIIHKVDNVWVPYSKYQDKGLTIYKTSTYVKDGEICTAQLLCWNEQGRQFIHKLIENYRKSNDIQAKKN